MGWQTELFVGHVETSCQSSDTSSAIKLSFDDIGRSSRAYKIDALFFSS